MCSSAITQMWAGLVDAQEWAGAVGAGSHLSVGLVTVGADTQLRAGVVWADVAPGAGTQCQCGVGGLVHSFGLVWQALAQSRG